MAETREFQFANIAEAELFSPMNAMQTGMLLVQADDFPDPNYGAVVSLVLRDDENDKFEVMYMVDRIGAACVVERGKEGTTPQTWPAGTVVRNSITAGFFEKLAALPRTRFRTSKPYPYIFNDEMDSGGSLLRDEPSLNLGDLGVSGDNAPDSMNLLGQPIEGVIDVLLLQYNNYPPEEIDCRGQPIEGVLDSVLLTYSNYPPEEINCGGQPIEGVLDVALVSYPNYQVESIDNGGTVLSGVLA